MQTTLTETLSATAVDDHKPNYVGVFGTLLALTVVTVALSRVNLGGARNTALAIAVASFKASLVALYFMHLKFEKRLLAALLIVPLFLAAALILGLVPDMVRSEGARHDTAPEPASAEHVSGHQ